MPPPFGVYMTAGKVLKSAIAINRFKDSMQVEIEKKCKGIRQRDVAKTLGISQPRVSVLLNGANADSFSTDSLLSYCYVLDINVSVLINDKAALKLNAQ